MQAAGVIPTILGVRLWVAMTHPRPVGPPPTLHLTPQSPSWPRELEHISTPPENLWVQGQVDLLHSGPKLAIVGSRSPSQYGHAQALRFGAALARAGVCVVSGLARGVDSAAHEGALGARGATLAVLGSSVDRAWPEGILTERLRREGLLVSEYRPGTGPRRHHFPMRNRIISGICQAVLIVEAAHASGSLITARWAADQSRDVFVIPGRVDHPMSRGCLRLIREGATPVDSPEQLLEDLYGSQGRHAQAALRPAIPGGEEGHILRVLQGETLLVDQVAARTDQPIGLTLTRLVNLELEGWVHRGPGGLYSLGGLARDGGRLSELRQECAQTQASARRQPCNPERNAPSVWAREREPDDHRVR